MKKIRDPADFEVENGLQMWQLPHRKLVYKEGTEDIFHYRRKTGLNIDQEFLTNRRAVLDMDATLKRRKI